MFCLFFTYLHIRAESFYRGDCIFNFQAGDQPVVNEVGPFVYREVRRKVGITKEADIIIYGRYTVQFSFTGP